MGKRHMFAVVACVFALCLALAGCGSSADEAKKAFAGTWDLTGMTQDGEQVGAQDLATLKSLGLEVYVNLNNDGTANLILFNERLDGTWEATSASAGKIKVDNQEIAITIEDSKLKLTQDASTLLFEKGQAKEPISSSSASKEATSSSASGEAASSSVSGESASSSASSGQAN